MANLKNCTKLQLIGVMYVWLFGVAIVLLARWLYVRLQLNRDLSLLYVLFRVKRKQAEYLRRRTTVADLFEAQADLNAQRVCVLSADNNGAQLTFAQHDELANRVAHWALAQGLKKGDVVALLLENCLEYTAIWLGLAKLGVVSALINTQTRGQSLLKSLAAVQPSALIVGCESMPLILPVLNDLADLTSFAALSDIESSVSSIVHNPPLSSSTAINMSEADDMSLLRRLGIAADVHKPPIAKSSIACPSLWLFQGSKHLSSPERQAGFNSLDEALSNSSSERPSKSVRADLLPSDLLFYVFTSGTTGAAPKAAKIRHLRFLLAGPAFFTAHRLDPSYDRLYCPLPLYHSSAGMIAVSMCWFGAMPLIVRNKFSASQFFPDCVKYQATCVQYIGEILRYVLSTPPSSFDRQHVVRKALGNGLRPEVWKAFQQRFGVDYVGEFYGSTEGNALLINNTNHVGACGYLPRFSYHVYPLRVVRFDVETETPIRGSDGFCQPCAPGEVGELLGRIDSRDATRQFDGYTSHKATVGKICVDAFAKGDAWFRTGDLMRVDADRYVYFVDRIGDTFRWRGENVSTSEVADIMHAFSAVQEAVVYGVEVPNYEGRAGMACVVLASPEHELFPWIDLYQHLETSLPKYAQPLFIRIQAQTEVTSTFKHRKLELVNSGFMPRDNDQLYWRDDAARTFVPLSQRVYDDICCGVVKL